MSVILTTFDRCMLIPCANAVTIVLMLQQTA